MRKHGQILGGLTVVLILSGCSIAKRPGTTGLPPTPVGLIAGVEHPSRDLRRQDMDRELPVFILSDRDLRTEYKGVNPFGNSRNDDPVPHFAVAEVSIGANVSYEELKRETVEDVKRKRAKVRLDSIRVEPPPPPGKVDPWLVRGRGPEHQDNAWIQAIRAELARSIDRKLTVFVHGYNTQLVTNTEQAAAMLHYLGRQEGAMINFEWPSEGNLLGYSVDKGNAAQSTRLFRAFLSNIGTETDCSDITIIAHSAGNPIVVQAMRELRLLEYDMSADQLRSRYRIGQVVLAAPDMDQNEFFNAVYDRFYEVADGVAVYTNPKDKALDFSSKIFRAPRLGQSVGLLAGWETEALRRVREIEMIDVSLPEKRYGSGEFGHSYFYHNPWVSTDIGLFILGLTPEQRGLQRGPGGFFWEFPDDYLDRLGLLSHRMDSVSNR